MSEAEIERAKKARKTHQALNTPTAQDYKTAMRMNLMTNNEVTTKDIDSA